MERQDTSQKACPFPSALEALEAAGSPPRKPPLRLIVLGGLGCQPFGEEARWVERTDEGHGRVMG